MNKISYSGYRFPPEIIQQAIWLYLQFTLSLRDVEDLFVDRLAKQAELRNFACDVWRERLRGGRESFCEPFESVVRRFGGVVERALVNSADPKFFRISAKMVDGAGRRRLRCAAFAHLEGERVGALRELERDGGHGGRGLSGISCAGGADIFSGGHRL